MRLFHKIVVVVTLAFAIPTALVGLAASDGMRSIEVHAAQEATRSLRRAEVQQLERLASERAHAVEATLAPLAEDVRVVRAAWEETSRSGGSTGEAILYANPGLPGFPGYGRVHQVYGAYADFDRRSRGSPWMPRFAVDAARRDPATSRHLARELDRLMRLTPLLHDLASRHADLVDLGWIVLVDGPANAQPPYDYPRMLAENPGIADVIEAEEGYVRSVGPVENPERTLRWLEPYFDAFKGLWMTSCVVPLYDGDTFEGSAGLDILLSTVSSEVLATAGGQEPQPFLVAASGRLLAVAPGVLDELAVDEVHRSALRRSLLPAERQAWPIEELEALGTSLARHPDPGVRELVAAMSRGETVSREIALDGRQVFVASSPVASTGWSLGVVRPIEVALAGVEDVRGAIRDQAATARHQFLLFVLLILGIALGVGAFVNLVAVRPVEAFLRRVELLRYDTLEFTDEIARRRDEIGLLSHKFSELVAQIRSARDDLASARDSMGREVEERTAELQARTLALTQLEAARKELEEAGRHKDRFLAMLGHELRNPLFAIRTAVRLLASEGDAEQLRGLQAVLDRQSAHLTRLVDGLLEVARITENKFRLERQPLDLAEVLRRVTEDRAPQLSERAVTLHTQLDGALWVDGDEVRLTQVFANLLGNAIKFTPHGGTVWVEARREGDDVVVRVRDTGVGMEAETRAHLFEPFRQGPQDLARSEGGLGLGLALAKGVVELHGGTIEAFSEGKGTGSEFVVRLAPCARSVPSPAPTRAAVSTPRKVLVVEDNEDTADLLARALERAGHAVLVARTGVEALDRVRRDHPAVVLCDLGLPQMSGYEVARAVRADPSLRDLLLVALTGYGQAEDVRRSREAGFDVHLTKPVDLDAIEAAFAEWTG